MSSTDAEPGTAADQAYFRAVEESFLALRGKATLLAADDWQTAREWHRLGIPVDLVVSVMEALFERQRERKSKRGISSLRYFRAAVAAAWDERQAMRAGGGAPVPDLGPPAAARLEALAGALPESLEGVEQIRRDILALTGPLDLVEAGLTKIETRLLGGLEEHLSDRQRSDLEAKIDRALSGLPSPATGEERDQLRRSLRRQALRRLSGVPALSLFSPTALAGSASDDAS